MVDQQYLSLKGKQEGGVTAVMGEMLQGWVASFGRKCLGLRVVWVGLFGRKAQVGGDEVLDSLMRSFLSDHSGFVRND